LPRNSSSTPQPPLMESIDLTNESNYYLTTSAGNDYELGDDSILESDDEPSTLFDDSEEGTESIEIQSYVKPKDNEQEKPLQKKFRLIGNDNKKCFSI
jgi:hypothetical protein